MNRLPTLPKLADQPTALLRAQVLVANLRTLQDKVNELIQRANGVDIPPVAMFTITQPTTMSLAVDASNSSDVDGTIAAYAWTFGDGTSAAGKTASHTYAKAGLYTVGLTVTDDRGVSASTVNTIAATSTTPTNMPPTASFTTALASDNATVTVDASASTDPDGTIRSYAWTFGDGSSAIGKTSTHTYTATGSYTVALTVTDDDGATGTATRIVSPTIVVTPVPPSSSTYGDAGGNGVQQSGSGIVAYSAGTGDFSTRVNLAGTSSSSSLPAGTFAFSDFAYDGGGTSPTQFWFGAKITAKGILGAGSKYTTIQMTPSTSTKASDVPKQGSFNSNQLQYVYCTTPGLKIDGVKILGTEQGHLYNGLRIQGVANPVLSNSTITHIPGNDSSPPGETFGVNFQGCTGTVLVTNVTGDGGGVSAAMLGSNNSSATYEITNLYTHDHPYSAGWASWEHKGVMNFYNWRMINGARAFNAERLAGVVNFYDPVWSDPKSQDCNPTYESGWTGGTLNFYFSSAAAWQRFLAARTSQKWIYILTNTSSHSLGVTKDIVKVYLGNGGNTSPVDAAGFKALTWTKQTTTDYVHFNSAFG